MATIGYNQCNNVAINNYQPTYLNVDLSLVKNEPVDSVDFQQTTQIYHYVQHHQQISPQLPPTPPSPTGSSNDTTTVHFEQHNLNNNSQINQTNQINNQQQLTNQVNQMCSKMTSQIQQMTSQQIVNQIKNQQTATQVYLPAQNQTKQIELVQQNNQQVTASKYRKMKGNSLHNLKPYSVPDQTIGRVKSNSISRRNERERKRVKNVNEGFKKLRDRIPNNEKKMSKVETLRSAVKYIRKLHEMLNTPSSDCTDTDILFNIIQRNASSSLHQAIKMESELSNNSTIEQDQNSSLDYFDLAELLSQ